MYKNHEFCFKKHSEISKYLIFSKIPNRWAQLSFSTKIYIDFINKIKHRMLNKTSNNDVVSVWTPKLAFKYQINSSPLATMSLMLNVPWYLFQIHWAQLSFSTKFQIHFINKIKNRMLNKTSNNDVVSIWTPKLVFKYHISSSPLATTKEWFLKHFMWKVYTANQWGSEQATVNM